MSGSSGESLDTTEFCFLFHQRIESTRMSCCQDLKLHCVSDLSMCIGTCFPNELFSIHKSIVRVEF